VIKAVNSTGRARRVELALQGMQRVQGGRSIVLSASDLKAENNLDQPQKIAPVESTFTGTSPDLAPYSMTVLRIPYTR
jgi:alpha-L-arabinofuranosidase